MTVSTPRVTIGIATYNRPHFLKEAVASALAQTCPDIEVLIGHNPCEDEEINRVTRMWCEEMASRDPRVRYQPNPENIGATANFNRIGDGARGEYVAFIGDDDRLLPAFVETLLAAAEPDARVVFCNHYVTDPEGHRLEEESRLYNKHFNRDRIPAGDLVKPEVWAWQQAITLYGSIIRTRDFQRLRFLEHLDNPDTEFFIRITHEGGRFVFVPEYLADYRLHDNTYTAQGFRIQRLIKHLLSAPVSPGIEPYKRAFIGAFLPSSVSISLLQGDVETARSLIRHSYYPASKRVSPKGLLLNVLAHMPGQLGPGIHRVLHRIKHADYYRNNTYHRYLDTTT